MEENDKEKEEQKTTNDQEIIQDILDKRNKNPRKSWFGVDKDQKDFHKRFSQENIEFTSSIIPEEEIKNPQNEEKEVSEKNK